MKSNSSHERALERERQRIAEEERERLRRQRVIAANKGRRHPVRVDLAGGSGRAAIVTPAPGGDMILEATLQLTDAQIKALPSTPVAFGIAPGAGRYLVPILCVWEKDWPEPQYTNVSDSSLNQGATDFVVTWGANVVNAFRAMPFSFFQFGGSKMAGFSLPFQAISDPVVASDQLWGTLLGYTFNGFDHVENNDWFLSCDNAAGDFTGGGPLNKLTVRLFYAIRTYEALT